MKVLSIPTLSNLSGRSGINTVIEKHYAHSKKYGIEFVGVDDPADVIIEHAGMLNNNPEGIPIVSFVHGLYWTSDYDTGKWYHQANKRIVRSVKRAREIVVPSRWVAETFQRDMHISPHVVPHGIDWGEWQHDGALDDYVFAYAKNRSGVDVCDPSFLTEFAKRFPQGKFIATFAQEQAPSNVHVTGVLAADAMKRALQRSLVYMNTTKETWGITMVEAMACGTPVLAFNHGGAAELVEHGVTGYLARPGDYDDLEAGLRYCLEHRRVLGGNAREHAKQYTWEKSFELLVRVLQRAVEPRNMGVSVVIPVYNKTEEQYTRAVASVLNQEWEVDKIVVVDDGSKEPVRLSGMPKVEVYRIPNSGVAEARNYGIRKTDTEFVCCLDADDWLDPRFMQAIMPEMLADPTLAIGYTGLMTHLEDGRTGLSRWPGELDVDRQFNYNRRMNQIPTCNVFRRKDFDKLGGFRSRYAPKGAGTEDADFWTRILAYGGEAKKVTDAGLFNYSHGGGNTSESDYAEVDWLAWHPFSRDGLHPFASPATPANNIAHFVRQYDEPTVSVIIPVGSGHVNLLVNALDSLEAQSFRNWEAVVVFNCREDYYHILEQYPFVRAIDIGAGAGAGEARNEGVHFARGDFLLFLDADDWLVPDALTLMIQAWNETQSMVYTDYIGVATVEKPSELPRTLTIEQYDPETKIAHIRHNAADFDCEKALMQKFEDKDTPYLWCNVTTLVPKAWHYEVGGFDETMESWEDVLYWYKLAWSGKCFVRIPQPLMVYRFNTGTRRQHGLDVWSKLLAYIRQQKSEFNIMGCNCGKKKKRVSPTMPNVSASYSSNGGNLMSDDNMVRIEYMSQNRGGHGVYGTVTRTFYGYRKGGDTFLMHRADVEAQPQLYREVDQHIVQAPPVVVPAPVPTPIFEEPEELEPDVRDELEPAPELTESQFVALTQARTRASTINPQLLPGVSANTAKEMELEGLNTYGAILDAGYAKLTKITGIGAKKARMILDYINGQLDE
jgi:glycosyltransferase involved in cell wall biosynthesis